MGIEVRVEEGVDIVGPGPNGVSKWHLIPALATQVFTILSSYRILDVITFLGEMYPPVTVIERTPAPTGPLQVHIFLLLSIGTNSNLLSVFP